MVGLLCGLVGFTITRTIYIRGIFYSLACVATVGLLALISSLVAIDHKSPPLAIFSIICLLILDASLIAIWLRSDENDRQHKLGIGILGLGALSATTMLSGMLYAGVWSGRECLFSFKDGHTVTMRFIRSLADGHLTMIDKTRYYIPRSEITEIECERKK